MELIWKDSEKIHFCKICKSSINFWTSSRVEGILYLLYHKLFFLKYLLLLLWLLGMHLYWADFMKGFSYILSPLSRYGLTKVLYIVRNVDLWMRHWSFHNSLMVLFILLNTIQNHLKLSITGKKQNTTKYLT